MGAHSHIEWCDHTFNPWEGCTKVSPGCAHCYAEARNARFAGGANWGPGAPRRRTRAENWKQPLKWNKAYAEEKFQYDQCRELGSVALEEPRRPRVFCASLADWLDDEVPIEWLADLLDLIRRTPNLDWLLLTKRPQNWRDRIKSVGRLIAGRRGPGDVARVMFVVNWLDGSAPANVWIGTTVEDQTRADERIAELLKIPARVRFLSCEPLLGPVELLLDGECSSWRCPECGSAKVIPDQVSTAGKFWSCPDCKQSDEGEADWKPDIHWVICGGESGPGARPMHPDWARSLRDQCEDAGVAFFFKQWGEWLARSQWLLAVNEAAAVELVKKSKMKSAVMRRDCGIDAALGDAFTSNDSDSAIYHVGKQAAGRLLDGVEHSALPEAQG